MADLSRHRLMLSALLALAAPAAAHDPVTGRASAILNEGVMVEAGAAKVLFDPVYDNAFGRFAELPADLAAAIVSGAPPYDGVDAVFVSHAHGDHFSAGYTVQMLAAQPGLRLFLPVDALALLRAAEGWDDGWLARITVFDLANDGPHAVAVLDGQDGTVKRLITGSFVNQHSAQFAGDGTIVLFDNMGSGPDSLPSRVLALDLADGSERVVHARGNEGEFTAVSGNLDLSVDGRRVLVAYTQAGRVNEIDLRSGAVLSVFENLHTGRAPGETGLYKIFGAWYVPPDFPLD